MARLALENGLVVDRTDTHESTPPSRTCVSWYLRVHGDPVRPIVVGWCESALRWRLERTAVRILRDITSLIVDDSLHERRQFFVLRQQCMVMRELVRRIS